MLDGLPWRPDKMFITPDSPAHQCPMRNCPASKFNPELRWTTPHKMQDRLVYREGRGNNKENNLEVFKQTYQIIVVFFNK